MKIVDIEDAKKKKEGSPKYLEEVIFHMKDGAVVVKEWVQADLFMNYNGFFILYEKKKNKTSFISVDLVAEVNYITDFVDLA